MSALALHALCLGALIGLGYIRPAAAPPQETAIELAVVPAPEPPRLPESPALPEPQPIPPAAAAVAEPVAPLPPEPAEAAATPAETGAPPPPEPDPAPAEAAEQPPPETPPQETPTQDMPPLDPPPRNAPPPSPPSALEPAAAAVPPPPVEAPRPPPPVHAPSRPPQHAQPTPRAAPARQETAASAAAATSTAATATASAVRHLGDQEATLEARIRDAVQAAVHYPASARMMGITGRARLLLDYRSGIVAGPLLTQSSGTPTLDEAALTAARVARYPPAPPEIEGHLLRLLVWVEFKPG